MTGSTEQPVSPSVTTPMDSDSAFIGVLVILALAMWAQHRLGL